MKSLFKLLLLVIIGLLGYNYFLGDAQEREQSERIVRSVGNLGAETWAFLKAEKAKFDDGKYDDALEQLGELYNSVANESEDLFNEAPELKDEWSKLQKERNRIEKEYEKTISDSDNSDFDRNMREIQKDWERLHDRTGEALQHLEEFDKIRGDK